MTINRITRFSERVYDAVLKLMPQLSPDADLPSEKYFRSFLESENIHFFIAEPDDKQITGMLTIATYSLPSGIKVWIEDVVIDESQRGKGFGRELMLFAIDYSKSLGADYIWLTSRPARIAANRLYKDLGFVRHETNVYKYLLK